jgi:hypothetical protein
VELSQGDYVEIGIQFYMGGPSHAAGIHGLFLDVIHWNSYGGISSPERYMTRRSHLPVLVFVGSRGPFVPFKNP